MTRRQHLTETEKLKIVEMFKEGKKKIDIAKVFSVNRCIITKIIKRFDEYGTVKTAPRTGRPRKTTEKLDRRITRLSKSKPFYTASEIKNQLGLENISSRTVSRRLDENYLFSREACKKPLVSKKNRATRLQFAKEHLNWTATEWSKILWSDESKFNLFENDSKNNVRRPTGQRFNVKYLKPTVKFGGGNAMVWGCFSRNGLGPLIQIKETMDRFVYRDILQNHMLPFANEKMLSGWSFQHDNDPKHSSKLVKTFLAEQNVNVIKWPSQSPDLNPIEHLWDYVGRQLGSHSFTNKAELMEKLTKIWSEIPAEFCVRLIESMPRRCHAVLKSKGYPTSY
ncbi:Transposable element Tcb1 transposase [Anthophora quadrimaculata]